MSSLNSNRKYNKASLSAENSVNGAKIPTKMKWDSTK